MNHWSIVAGRKIRMKIRRELLKERWIRIDDEELLKYPEIKEGMSKADIIAQKVPERFYQILMEPAIVEISRTRAENIINFLVNKTGMRPEEGAFKVMNDDKLYTITFEYPCG